MCSVGNYCIDPFPDTLLGTECRFEGSDEIVSRVKCRGTLYVLSLSERLLIARRNDVANEIYSIRENGTIFYEGSNFWSINFFMEHLGLAILHDANGKIYFQDYRCTINQVYNIGSNFSILAVCRNCILVKDLNQKKIKLITIVKSNDKNAPLQFSEKILNEVDISCEKFAPLADEFFIFIQGIGKERVLKMINIDTLEYKQVHLKIDYDENYSRFNTCHHSVLILGRKRYQFDRNTFTFTPLLEHKCYFVLPLAQDQVDKIRQLLSESTGLPRVIIEIMIDYLNLDYLKKIEKKYIK